MAAFLRWYYPIQVPGYSSQPDICPAPRAISIFLDIIYLLSRKDEQIG